MLLPECFQTHLLKSPAKENPCIRVFLRKHLGHSLTLFSTTESMNEQYYCWNPVVECSHGQRKALGSSPGRATLVQLLQMAPNIKYSLKQRTIVSHWKHQSEDCIHFGLSFFSLIKSIRMDASFVYYWHKLHYNIETGFTLPNQISRNEHTLVYPNTISLQ